MALIKYVNYPGRPCVCWFRLLNLHSTAQVPPFLALKWKYWSFTLAAILWDSHRIPDGFLMESRGIAGTRVSLRDSFFPILGWFIPSRSFPARFPTDSMRSRVISVSFPCHSVGVLFFCRLDQFLLTLIANLFARWNETVDAPPCKNMNCRRPSVLISIAPVVLLLSIGRPSAMLQ